ncbi:MAG: aspartate aminotransferase family protein, partial [Patescibacteria group bacterium]
CAPTTQDFSFVPSGIAEGCWVWSIDGEKCFDSSSGPGVFNIGHNHPKLVEAMRDVMPGFGANEYANPWFSKLSKKLCEITPGSFEKVVFPCSSGGEAVEAAIRAVELLAPTRPYFIHFEKAFHGRPKGARTLTNRLHANRGSRPAFPTILLPFPELGTDSKNFMTDVKSRLRNHNANKISAVIWEPIQGEGGIRPTDPRCWKKFLKEIIYPNAIVLIADEVQTGFGRTGKMFACEYYGVEPDIICLAKGIANGEHLGVIVMNKKVCWPEGGLYSNTWGGDPRSVKSALVAIDIIEKEKLAKNAEEMGEIFHNSFTRNILKFLPRDYIAEGILWDNYSSDSRRFDRVTWGKIVVDFGGIGLMRRIQFEDKNDNPLPELRNRVREEARRRHILLLSCGDSAIRVMPPLVVSEEEIKWLAKELAESVATAVKNF